MLMSVHLLYLLSSHQLTGRGKLRRFCTIKKNHETLELNLNLLFVTGLLFDEQLEILCPPNTIYKSPPFNCFNIFSSFSLWGQCCFAALNYEDEKSDKSSWTFEIYLYKLNEIMN